MTLAFQYQNDTPHARDWSLATCDNMWQCCEVFGTGLVFGIWSVQCTLRKSQEATKYVRHLTCTCCQARQTSFQADYKGVKYQQIDAFPQAKRTHKVQLWMDSFCSRDLAAANVHPVRIIVERHLVAKQGLRGGLVIGSPGQLDVTAPVELNALPWQHLYYHWQDFAT